ncbi:MAG: ribonuclease HII, partial [Calditrichales bacterium]
GVQADYLLVDGEKLGHVPVVSRGIVKGDQKSFTIAAASIIAKQVRDSYMIQLSETLPWYMFEQNKGYGTQAHLQAIARYGLSAYHRRTFTKKYSNQNK